MEKRKPSKATESHKRIAKMRYGRIDVIELSRLTVEYCDKKAINPDHQMSNELGEIIMIIVDKMISQGNYRGYTPDWKEDMMGKAYEHCVKYVKNFKRELVINGNEELAFNYYAMIITNAFKQSIKKSKLYVENNKLLNESFGYDKDVIEAEGQIINSDWIFPDETRLDYDAFNH